MYIGYGKYSCYHATWSWVALRYILRGCITPPKILRTVRPGNLKVKSVGRGGHLLVRPFRFLSRTVLNFDCRYGSKLVVFLMNSLYGFQVLSVNFVLASDYVRLVSRSYDVFRLLALRVISCLVRFFDPVGQTGTFWWGLRVVILPLRSRSRLLLYPAFFRYVG